MDMKNLVLIFFIIVIVLTIVYLFPEGNKTGHFIISTISLEIGILVIIFSLFVIAVILSKKSYYPF